MALLDLNGLTTLWQCISSKLAYKVDKVDGKGLSTNDYTNEDKDKLENIEAGAQVNTVNSVNSKTGNVDLIHTDVGAAPSVHNHVASDITSGTLSSDRLPTVPVTKGGTGVTSLTAGSYLVGKGASAVTLKTVDEVKTDLGIPTGAQGQIVGFDANGNMAAEDNNGIMINSTNILMPLSKQWESSAYGNGKFVAIGNYSNKAVYSDDGINWTETTLPSESQWNSIVYGNNKFVTIAGSYDGVSSNTSAYSTDGITWTASTLPSSADWLAITFGNGKFIAIATNSKVAYSEDGISWSEDSIYEYTNSWISVACGSNRFVVISSFGDFAYSEDGIDWTTSSLPSINGTYCSIIYENDKFVVVGNDTNELLYSEDGINWTKTTSPSSNYWKSIEYGNGKFVVATASNNPSNKIIYSSDGINWTEATLPIEDNWGSIVYGENKFILFSTSNIVLYSTDGINWDTSVDILTNSSNEDITSRLAQIIANNKIDKVTTPTEGNIPVLTSTGTLTDSGTNPSSFVQTAEKGVANGVATLNEEGKVPETQLDGWHEMWVVPFSYPNLTTFSTPNIPAYNADGGIKGYDLHEILIDLPEKIDFSKYLYQFECEVYGLQLYNYTSSVRCTSVNLMQEGYTGRDGDRIVYLNKITNSIETDTEGANYGHVSFPNYCRYTTDITTSASCTLINGETDMPGYTGTNNFSNKVLLTENGDDFLGNTYDRVRFLTTLAKLTYDGDVTAEYTLETYGIRFRYRKTTKIG